MPGVLLVLAFPSLAHAQLAVESAATSDATVATELASVLAPGIAVTDASSSLADPRAAGTFSGGASVTGFGLDDGIVLSTGSVAAVQGTNDGPDASSSWAGAGDEALALELGHFNLYDAAALRFQFSCPAGASGVRVDYVFASEEQAFDAVGVFVDGIDAATLPGTSTPVTTDALVSADLLRDNLECGETCPFQLAANGLSVVLTAEAALDPGRHPHTFEVVIADEFADDYDSWVFMRGLTCVGGAQVRVPGLSGVGASGLAFGLLAVASMVLRAHRRRPGAMRSVNGA